ncbi:MAG: DNA repair protein RadA [Flavobacteriaceae bacterium]
MAKAKKAFFCQNCGAQHPQWQGQCKACKEWNTLVEEIITPADQTTSFKAPQTKNIPQSLVEIKADDHPRILSQDPEMNRILGGGFVPGAVMLLGGEPGIGKSTLLLQLSMQMGKKVLYVSGEESLQQIKLRADRLGLAAEHTFILSETDLGSIFSHLENINPELIIIDSIQTLQTDRIDSGAGSVSQIKACTAELIKLAKTTQIPIVLVGHITKEGQLAGPKILEHMVDTVLQFEGDRNHMYRIIRVQKNRFGATSELGIYEMQTEGLRPVTNPSELLLSQPREGLSGHAVVATIEGIRPLMIEVQALVSTAVYGTPQRSTTGFNTKRLNMLLAVLEKRAGFALATKDVFINIAGGLSLEDPALDLAVVAAILSSYLDVAIPAHCCFAAEVGLSGELRPVPKVDQRISEAAKLGFESIVVAGVGKQTLKHDTIKIHNFDKLADVLTFLFHQKK